MDSHALGLGRESPWRWHIRQDDNYNLGVETNRISTPLHTRSRYCGSGGLCRTVKLIFYKNCVIDKYVKRPAANLAALLRF